MISKIECSIIECDNCLDIYENSDGISVFSVASDALENITEDGWFKEIEHITLDSSPDKPPIQLEKHYCGMCVIGWDEQTDKPMYLDESRKDLHKKEVSNGK